MSAASGGNSEPKQGQRSQSVRGFCPRSTMRVPQPDIIEHFGNADAVPQPPERCLSRKAGIMRYCPRPLRDVEDAVPYIYFHDSSQIYFAPFPTHRRGQVAPPYRTFAAPLSGGQRAGRPTHHISPPQFLINSYLLPPNYFLRPTAILQLRPLSAGGKM